MHSISTICKKFIDRTEVSYGKTATNLVIIRLRGIIVIQWYIT